MPITPPKAGERAPDFELPAHDGSVVRLSDLAGRWVVLYFYPKDNTPGCTLEAQGFQRDVPRFTELGATVLGVSLDSARSHQSFCAKEGLTFRLLSDIDRTVARNYGSLGSILGFKIVKRNTFLIDPSGRIAHVWLNVSASRHSAEVLAALQNR